MFSTFFNQQLGFYNSDDKTIKINFLTRRYNEAYAKLNLDDADHITNLLICEGSLEGLYELGVDVVDRTYNLLEEFNKILTEPTCEKLIPHFQKKILRLKFHCLNATHNSHIALELMSDQDYFDLCYITEKQMLELDDVIERHCTLQPERNHLRFKAARFIASYYLRLMLTNPNMLENYAAYLCRCASAPSGKDIASRLSNFVQITINLPDTSFSNDLFPRWKIYSRNHSIHLFSNKGTISLSHFIAILARNIPAPQTPNPSLSFKGAN